MNNQGLQIFQIIKKKKNKNISASSKKQANNVTKEQLVKKMRKINLMNKVNTMAAPSGQQTVNIGNTANVSQEIKVKKVQQFSQQIGIQMPKISLKRIQNQQASAKNNVIKTPGKIQLLPLTSRRQKSKEQTNHTTNEPFNKSINNIQKMQEILKQQKQNATKLQIADTTASTSIANQVNHISNPSTQIQNSTNTQDVYQDNANRFRIKSQRSVKNFSIQNNQEVINPNSTPAQAEPQQIWNSLQLPIGPGNALKLFKEQLTNYEQSEILDYKQIYYIGISSEKIISDLSNKNNFGFDDDKGFYLPIAKDHVAYRYELVEMLGMGSFAQVLRCFDHKHKQFVALKVIRSKKRFHQQAQIEIRLLEHIKQNDSDQKAHVVHAQDYLVFRKHIIIVFELLSMNLYELIRLNNYKGFPQQLIRKFAVQLLSALAFMKKENIIHCDFKPENILLIQPTKSQVTVIDFGSACFLDEKMYTYIQSRFYRAPEIVLGYPAYTSQIDMWSFGCIMGELHSGRPLFPAESEAELFSMILELKGLPPEEFINNSPKKKLFFDQSNQPRPVYAKKGQLRIPGTKTLPQAVRSSDEIFLDFVEGCIHYDPDKRLTPDQAMQHAWIAKFHEKETSKKSEIVSLTSRKFQSDQEVREVGVRQEKELRFKTMKPIIKLKEEVQQNKPSQVIYSNIDNKSVKL